MMLGKIEAMKRFLLLLPLLVSCGVLKDGAGDEADQTVALLSEIMSSVDEAFLRSELRAAPLPTTEEGVEGGKCLNAFGACVDGVLTVDYNKCTLLEKVLSGQATIKYYGDARCRIDTNNEYLVRVPNYSIAYSGNVSAKTDVLDPATDGMKIKKVSSTGYEVSVKALRRKLLSGNGEVVDLFLNVDESTPFHVVGEARNKRTLTGGDVIVEHNLIEAATSEMTANALLWDASCTCPTSGNWTGYYRDPKNTDKDYREYILKLEIKSCGKAVFTRDNMATTTKDSYEVDLESCVSL